MSEQQQVIPAGWERRDKPPTLHRRLIFSGYAETRRFLDWLAALSEREGYYPSTSFATTYVNLTLDARDGKAIGEADIGLAIQIESFYQENTAERRG